jgi:type 2 lantibiotic biosynthesis protein LanM
LAREERLWQAAEWYRALSLPERVPPTPAGTTLNSLPGRAVRRLDAWRAQKPFDEGALFAERLARDAVSEEDLLFLVAEPAEDLKGRLRDTPAWLAALRDAFSETSAAEKLFPLLDAVEPDHPLHGCLTALAPLFHRSLTAVEQRVEALRHRHPRLPIDPVLLQRTFVENIAPTVLFQISKPVVLELHIARLRGELDGETPHDRFDSFLRHLGHEGGFESLLLKYPVLARQLVTTVDQWADHLGELLAHLCADWPALCTTFADGADPGPLVEIEADKGDRHRKGRSVALLRFESGMQLLHKPRSLAADGHFQQLLTWLNDRGAQPRLRTLTLLDRGDYGWSEFAAVAPCATAEEVARFFERQGGYLALLHALHATDLHNENLIAAGEHPVLVDLEALFHPHVHAGDPILTSNLAAGALDESVWQVGILPRRVWSDDDSIGVDMSGLGGQAGQLNPHRLVSWEARGSDTLRVTRGRAELPVSENQPRLGDRDVDVLDHKDAFVAGFTRMYRLLCRHRAALLDEQLARFADDEIRVVVRSTNVYGLLWYESFHPDVLRDGLDRDRYFDRLWAEAVHRPYLARIIPAEQRDLLRGDIPVFTTTPRSRAIITSEGEHLADFLETPSLELARRRIAQLGDDDLVRQTWIIEASFSTLRMDLEGSFVRPPSGVRQAAAVTEEELTALADAVGRRLGELALKSTEGAHWLGVGPLDDRTWGLFPSGTDLYAGTAGMALFLAFLGALTGDPSHTLLAREASAPVRAHVRFWLDAGEKEDRLPHSSRPPIGGFDGFGSAVHLLTHLGVLWDDPELLAEAESLVETLPGLIDRDERLDVIYGAAGCLLSLLGLHAVRPSERTLEVAVRCGERLLATARPMTPGIAWTTMEDQPPLGGFSHGTAGIAFSLLQLASATGQERFRAAARAALAFDRSLFVPELANWADLRVFPSRERGAEPVDDTSATTTRPPMVAWCHGAPGIGLGRLGALSALDDTDMRGDIDAALAATIGNGFALNHSLCHGALGNVEMLLTAAGVLDRPEDHRALQRATAEIVSSIEVNGPVTGVPLGVETPGFMVGLSGIGYELLRLAAPDRVPSVLLLAPPSRHSRS